jgi:cytochrome d ubiquinol oxidase subunit I
VVYLTVFGAGLVFLLRILRKTPTFGERGPEAGVPVRTAGITAAPSLHNHPSHPTQPAPAE